MATKTTSRLRSRRPAAVDAQELAAQLRALMDLQTTGVITKDELAGERSRLLWTPRLPAPSRHRLRKAS